MWHGSNAAGDTVSDTVPASLGRCHHHSSCGCCDPQTGGVKSCSGVFIHFFSGSKKWSLWAGTGLDGAPEFIQLE